jgi:hypothetical protein
MLRRTNNRRPAGARTTIIDPDGHVASRYIGLLAPSRLEYFASAKAFLAESAT